MQLPTPANDRTTTQQNNENPRFRAIIRGITIENSKGNAEIPPSQQLRIDLEPTSYQGKIRTEWYRITKNENSKYRHFLERLTELGLYDNNQIRDDLALNKEFEFEVFDNDASWPPVKCKECDYTTQTGRGSRQHYKQTNHKIKTAGYILPMKWLDAPAPAATIQSNPVQSSPKSTSQPTSSSSISTPPTDAEITSVVVDAVKSSTKGITKQQLFTDLEACGIKRSDSFPIVIKMLRESKLVEKDGMVVIGS